MAIPDFQSAMLPVLTFFSDGSEHSNSDLIESMVRLYNVTQEELDEMLSSGTERVFNSRINWAKTYIFQAGLLERTQRSHYRITERGLDLMKQKPEKIDIRLLNRYPEFQEFQRRSSRPSLGRGVAEQVVPLPPEETMQAAFREFQSSLISIILENVKRCKPPFFEQLVVDLLVKMGYGGTHENAGKAVGRSGDGGIDGIIDEDRLGLDAIYIQAKRWGDTTVGKPEIQKFVGALVGRRAKKGVFITTSRFSQEAIDYAGSIEAKVVLIDGQRLAELMIEFGVGVTEKDVIRLKKIDTDYFEES